jgi:hypothetical protein
MVTLYEVPKEPHEIRSMPTALEFFQVAIQVARNFAGDQLAANLDATTEIVDNMARTSSELMTTVYRSASAVVRLVLP